MKFLVIQLRKRPIRQEYVEGKDWDDVRKNAKPIFDAPLQELYDDAFYKIELVEE